MKDSQLVGASLVVTGLCNILGIWSAYKTEAILLQRMSPFSVLLLAADFDNLFALSPFACPPQYSSSIADFQMPVVHFLLGNYKPYGIRKAYISFI